MSVKRNKPIQKRGPKTEPLSAKSNTTATNAQPTMGTSIQPNETPSPLQPEHEHRTDDVNNAGSLVLQNESPATPHGRSDYYKYQQVKPLLVSMLKTGIHRAKDIATEVKVSPNSTFYKYQHMAAVETELLLLTKEQMDYLSQKYPPEIMAAMEAKIVAQSNIKGKKVD